MKNYLSFGGGVNSVALYLYLVEQGVDFEAVFVHHATDWPETYDYVAGFQWWLKTNGLRPVTILRPNVNGFSNLFNYCNHYRIVPSRYPRWCTARFKIEANLQYSQKPCFQMIGFDFGEAGRAAISTENGVENRFPLIEAEIDRNGCVEIIKKSGLPVPPKSGCFICPYMSRQQWVDLRRTHPCLFASVVTLEKKHNEYLAEKGKKPFYISQYQAPLEAVVNENQRQVFEQDEYPPCQCGL